MAVKKLLNKEGIYLITLPANQKTSVKILAKDLRDIHMLYSDFQYIPLAFHKNGQLKSLFAFCQEFL